MSVGRKVVSWGGHTINGTVDFDTDILRKTEWPNSPRAGTVKTSRPGEYSLHVMGQPEAKIGRLEINALSDFADNWEELQGWFDWRLGQQYLVTSNLAGSDLRRMLCFPLEVNVTEGIETEGDNFGSVTLEAVYPVWESVSADVIADQTNVGDGDTFSVDNDGNTRSYPAFTITPTASKADTDGYTKRRRLIMASRTELPMGDPVKDGGYPVDLTANALDTATLDGANKVRTDLFDLAVSLNGELQNRWPDPATSDATTKLWTNVAARAMKSATLAANISDADDSLTVTRPYPFDSDDWPKAGGFLYIGTECLAYASRDAGNLYGLTRGIRNTTAAAHTAGYTVLWVEHRFLDILYGYASASDPDPPDDEKPLIDLSASSNTLHVLSAAFLNARDRRSRAMQRQHSTANGSEHVRQYEDGTSHVFEHNQAAAGKPALNTAVMEFPVPLSTTGPTLDITVGLSMLLHGYVEDMEGYESRLISQSYTQTPLSAENFPLPAVAKKLRLVGAPAAIFGDLSLDDVSTDVATATSGHFTVYKIVLDQDTPVNAFIAHHAKSGAGTSFVSLYRSEVDEDTGNDKLSGDSIGTFQGTLPDTTPEWVVYTPLGPSGADPAFYLNAGTYWLALVGGTIYTHHDTRTQARSYVGEIDTTPLPTNPSIQVDAFDQTPAFAVISYDTEPQPDAPQDTEHLIELANYNFALESARAPLLALQAEESFYDLRNARLQNDTNGTYIDLTWPMTLNAGLYVNTKTHRIVDLETGLDVPFVGVPGGGVWPYNSAGANTWSWTEQGATGLTIQIDHRGEWF